MKPATAVWLAREGQSAVVKALLGAGAPVNARGLREETPLHVAMLVAPRHEH